ncbi:MAG TPA: phage terminase large subunit family protein [Pyrinomonadaceae bacterium]|nr:phage terminase large subunit family protein [Pyrinomonadaceae bacterium]
MLAARQRQIEIPPAIDQALVRALSAAVPESDLTCSEWAEKYRYVSPERSARPGRWDNSVVPFLTEIMDAASSPEVRRVVFMKSSQVAGSEFLVNYVGYRIQTSPTMIIYCAESEDKAKGWTFESFDPTVEATPELRRRITALKGTEDNNQKRKKFPGGILNIVYASSAAQLSSRPAEVVILDEVDACVENAEGSPLTLLEARTKTFHETKKVILVSSPRDKETSVIEPEYEDSDKRSYYVPCPHCGEYQTLNWANVRWDEEPLDAYYVCDENGCVIEQFEKDQMLRDGFWKAEKPFRGSAGFKINELYSPFTNWGSMAEAFLKAKKNPTVLKTFVNTSLGETWEESGEKIEYADLKFAQEDYPAEVPDGVLVLTAGVDVQGNRLECEVVGWGYDHENWSIDYRVFPGDPSESEVWDDLKEYLIREFDGTDGKTFKVKAAIIDSGYLANEVYKFCRANAQRRFWAGKGLSTPGNPIAPRKPSIVGKEKYRVYGIGTSAAKDVIFAQLRKQTSPEGDDVDAYGGGPGYCHFPSDRAPEYFKGLCAEKKYTKFIRGRSTTYYGKVSENARNEPLDLRVYNLAAYQILNPDLKSFAAALKRRSSADPSKNKTPEVDKLPEAPKTEKKAPKRAFIPRKRGGFIKNW